MKTIHKVFSIAGCVLAFASSAGAAQAQRSPNGTWRCSAQGNIPIGVMTVSGSTYRFQAVRNTAWAPKPQDSMNGSGALRASGTTLNPTGGPLTTRLGARSGYFGVTGIPGDRYDYIDFFNDPEAAYVLRCHRP